MKDITLFDLTLINKLLSDIDQLSMSCKTGSSLGYLMWEKLGSIKTLMSMLTDHTEKLMLRQPLNKNIYPIESAIRALDVDGNDAPYGSVIGGLSSLNTLKRVFVGLKDELSEKPYDPSGKTHQIPDHGN